MLLFIFLHGFVEFLLRNHQQSVDSFNSPKHNLLNKELQTFRQLMAKSVSKRIMLGLIIGSPAKAYVYAWIFVIPPQSSTGMLLHYTFPNGQGQCSAYECHLPWIAECSGPGPASKISQPDSAAPIPAESSHSLLFSISLTLTFSLRP